jgi:glycosyltransferase involved in cell wall biosynthesis
VSPGSDSAGNLPAPTDPPLPDDVLDVSVVVPARNAARMLPACLESIVLSKPRELIVVDGESTDATIEIARSHGATVLSDRGRGLPFARILGADAATSPRVALIDADVVLPHRALADLIAEFDAGGYTALQAGLYSTSGPGYWGRALAEHHRTGRSRRWFGLVATIFDRQVLLEQGFDDAFRSGEDIELRWRFRDKGFRTAVSQTTLVEHRFAGDDFAFARDQFDMDGRGLGLLIRKRPASGARLLLLPLAAGMRGIVLTTLRGAPKWIPYYLAFVLFNYVGMAAILLKPPRQDLRPTATRPNRTRVASPRVPRGHDEGR